MPICRCSTALPHLHRRRTLPAPPSRRTLPLPHSLPCKSQLKKLPAPSRRTAPDISPAPRFSPSSPLFSAPPAAPRFPVQHSAPPSAPPPHALPRPLHAAPRPSLPACLSSPACPHPSPAALPHAVAASPPPSFAHSPSSPSHAFLFGHASHGHSSHPFAQVSARPSPALFFSVRCVLSCPTSFLACLCTFSLSPPASGSFSKNQLSFERGRDIMCFI